MKKYFIADVLSLTEILMGLTLIVMTVLRISANWAIWVVIVGELCDAFDGIAARRWPYPPTDKPYWWRIPKVVQTIEHLSDILLIGALAFYLLTQGTTVTYWIVLICGITIAGFCIGVETALNIIGKYAPDDKRRRLITIRRVVYLIGIAIGLVEIVYCTTWPNWIKTAVYIIGDIVGVTLVIVKWDRLTESHETFSEFISRGHITDISNRKD